MESDKTWMTIEECSEYLRCSERYLREKAANKEVPHTRFAGKALFNRDRIDDFLISQEEELNKPTGWGNEKESGATSNEIDTNILPNCDHGEIDALIEQLTSEFSDHFVTALQNNLRGDLRTNQYKKLSEKVYCQLSRWCHPRRKSKREFDVSPKAQRISEALFGRVIERTKHASYRG
jgi:excisionase family DNA binding protein